jgi:hypothetical protein
MGGRSTYSGFCDQILVLLNIVSFRALSSLVDKSTPCLITLVLCLESRDESRPRCTQSFQVYMLYPLRPFTMYNFLARFYKSN